MRSATAGASNSSTSGWTCRRPDVVGFDAADVAARWPVPGPKDDKYTQGVTGVLAGSATYPGAAVLCTGAAVAATSGHGPLCGKCCRRKCFRIGRRSSHRPARSRRARCRPGWSDPGLGTDEAGAAALWFALDTDLPVIVDADALTILAAHPDAGRSRTAPTVLTPHAGEFARLAGSPPGDDRVDATRRAGRQVRRDRAAQRQRHGHRRPRGRRCT